MTTDLPDLVELWDFNQPDETERRFREVLPRAEASGDTDYLLQLCTQIARTLGLQGKFDEAHAELDGVEAQLTDELPVARVRCLLERGRAFRSSGAPEKADPLFLEAWDQARACGADRYAVDAAHMVALVAPANERLAWNLKGVAIAEQSTDEIARRWIGTLLNNIGWDHHDKGEYEKAREAHQKYWDWARERAPGSAAERIAKWSVAKQLRCLGQTADALAMQRELEQVYLELEEKEGFVQEEMGECLLALDRPDEATPHFKNAYAILKEIDWVAADAARIERLKELAG